MNLRDLVQSASDAAAIHAAALRRQAAGRHDDALVLFEEAGERGHAPALTAVARLYDPIGFVAGRPFRAPDPRAAARYYRDAVQKGDAVAQAPRAALKTWLEEQARAGNGTAETALKEFWP
jgi:TPR repeat protein